MQVLKRGLKIKGKTVYGLETVFVPPSLIDEYGCIRKGSEAVLKGLLGIQWTQRNAVYQLLCP